jgi:hypothetical protein
LASSPASSILTAANGIRCPRERSNLKFYFAVSRQNNPCV